MKHTSNDYFTDCVADLLHRIPTEWEYTASPNDASPSYIINNLQIFIDHPDPTKRQDAEWTRFSIWDDDQNLLLQTDSFIEVIRFVSINSK